MIIPRSGPEDNNEFIEEDAKHNGKKSTKNEPD